MKKFWQSSNFWMVLVMFAGGIFAAFPAAQAADSISDIFGLVASGKLFHEFFKTATVDVKAWLLNSNTITYLGVLVTAVVGVPLPDDLLQALQALVQQIFGGGNLQGIIIAAFSLVTILFNFIRGRSSLVPKKAA